MTDAHVVGCHLPNRTSFGVNLYTFACVAFPSLTLRGRWLHVNNPEQHHPNLTAHQALAAVEELTMEGLVIE